MSQISLGASRLTRNFLTHPTMQRIMQSDLAKLIAKVSFVVCQFFYSNGLLFCLSLGFLERSIANHSSDEKTLKHKVIIDIRNGVISIGLYHTLSSSFIKGIYASMPLLLKFTFFICSLGLQGFLVYRIVKNKTELIKKLRTTFQSEDEPLAHRKTPSPDPLSTNQPPIFSTSLGQMAPPPKPTDESFEGEAKPLPDRTAPFMPTHNLLEVIAEASAEEESTSYKESEGHASPISLPEDHKQPLSDASAGEPAVLNENKSKNSPPVSPRSNKQTKKQPLNKGKLQKTKPLPPPVKRRPKVSSTSPHRKKTRTSPCRRRPLGKELKKATARPVVKKASASKGAVPAKDPNLQKIRRFRVVCHQVKQHFVVKHECHLNPQTFFDAAKGVESIVKALQERGMPSSPLIEQGLATLEVTRKAIHRIGTQAKIEDSTQAQRAITEFTEAIDALQQQVEQALNRHPTPDRQPTPIPPIRPRAKGTQD